VIVADASAMLEALLGGAAAATLWSSLFRAGEKVHAPHLIDLEVTQVLRRFCSRGEIEPDRCRTALADLSLSPLTRHSHALLLPRIWELRDNLTAYDAAYVALAEALDAPLLTRDRRIAAAPGHHARVELV
jgi:predicted nucleic acid-binding protein